MQLAEKKKSGGKASWQLVGKKQLVGKIGGKASWQLAEKNRVRRESKREK